MLPSTQPFFVRSHTTAPEIDARSWRLLVSGDGLIDERVYSLDELRDLTSRTFEQAISCGGTGRAQSREQVGLARWTGVPLATLLQRTGLRPGAVQVMPVGLDARYVHQGVDYGHVRRPLPLEKALDDVLLAYEMDGQPLPREHGHPVRLVVPGWAGIASIKWLGELRVTTTRIDSPWNTRWYRLHGADWTAPAVTATRGRTPARGQESPAPVG